MELCREIGALYIDTVDRAVARLLFRLASSARRRARTTRCARRVLAARRRNPGGTTAVSCCGANPGMVSWFVKQALLNVAARPRPQVQGAEDPRGLGPAVPSKLGVKGIHIAERDTQRAKQPKPLNVFVNTWSVEGFVSEGLQPAELGWGTHEKWMPTERPQAQDSAAAPRSICMQPGANTRVRSWTPTAQAQYGFLVTHNESISIADYFTVRDGRQGDLPADLPLRLSSLQRRGAVAARAVRPRRQAPARPCHILDEHEIVDGIDELGVLLYGHAKNAYWYGSQLSIEETRGSRPIRTRPACR